MHYGIYFHLQKDKAVDEWYHKPLKEGTAIRVNEQSKLAAWVVAHRTKCYEEYAKFEGTTAEQSFRRLTEEGINSEDPLFRNVCRSIAGLPRHGEGMMTAEEYHQEQERQRAESEASFTRMLNAGELPQFLSRLEKLRDEVKKLTISPIKEKTD